MCSLRDDRPEQRGHRFSSDTGGAKAAEQLWRGRGGGVLAGSSSAVPAGRLAVMGKTRGSNRAGDR